MQGITEKRGGNVLSALYFWQKMAFFPHFAAFCLVFLRLRRKIFINTKKTLARRPPMYYFIRDDCSTGPLSAILEKNAPLAQLVEQLTLNQRVSGSSPEWCISQNPVNSTIYGVFCWQGHPAFPRCGTPGCSSGPVFVPVPAYLFHDFGHV